MSAKKPALPEWRETVDASREILQAEFGRPAVYRISDPHLGRAQVDALRALKRHFDPHGIRNPGGTLGLDDAAPGPGPGRDGA